MRCSRAGSANLSDVRKLFGYLVDRVAREAIVNNSEIEVGRQQCHTVHSNETRTNEPTHGLRLGEPVATGTRPRSGMGEACERLRHAGVTHLGLSSIEMGTWMILQSLTQRTVTQYSGFWNAKACTTRH